jgi:quinolinate synthase
LVGFVREEKNRMLRQINHGATNKIYLIAELTNDECFQIVKEKIGWYPKIYDIYENGKRVFKHNNCLPCKNMSDKDLQKVKQYFPEYWNNAISMSNRIGKFWGRSEKELKIDCQVCSFD